MCKAKSTYDDNLILPYQRRPPWCCTVIPSRPDLLKDSLGIWMRTKTARFYVPWGVSLTLLSPQWFPLYSRLSRIRQVPKHGRDPVWLFLFFSSSICASQKGEKYQIQNPAWAEKNQDRRKMNRFWGFVSSH